MNITTERFNGIILEHFPTTLSEINWDYNSEAEIAATATFEFTRLEAKLI